jgi:prevent-host-death family protein
MTREVAVTQARDELADLINHVAYGNERIVLTRHGKPVAALVSPDDLAWLKQRDGEQVTLTSTGHTTEPQSSAGAPGPLRIAAEHRAPPQGGTPPVIG